MHSERAEKRHCHRDGDHFGQKRQRLLLNLRCGLHDCDRGADERGNREYRNAQDRGQDHRLAQ